MKKKQGMEENVAKHVSMQIYHDSAISLSIEYLAVNHGVVKDDRGRNTNNAIAFSNTPDKLR